MQAKNNSNNEIIEFNYDGLKEKVLITRKMNTIEKKMKYGKSYKNHIGQEHFVLGIGIFNRRYTIIEDQ